MYARAWLRFLVAAVVAGWVGAARAAETEAWLRTGAGEPLVSTNWSLAIDPAWESIGLRLGFGFATREADLPGSFLDSFTIALRGADPSVGAVLLTADATGVAWAPATPGGTEIAAGSIQRQAVEAPPEMAGEPVRFAYWIFLTLPEAFEGETASIYLSLFDNGDGLGSMGQLDHVDLVPGGGANSAPSFAAIPAFAPVPEGREFTLQLEAQDWDLPFSTPAIALVSGPAGLTVSQSGRVAWTPGEQQGPAMHQVTVKVTDHGTPPLSATNTFGIEVTEENRPPALDPVGDQTATEGALFVLNLQATDPDLPANRLAFGLISGPPGLMVHTSGRLAWLPNDTQGPGTYEVTVKVTDDGVPPGVSVMSFSIAVTEAELPLRFLGIAARPDGAFELRWVARRGRSYAVMYKTRLEDPVWQFAQRVAANADEAIAIEPAAAAAAQRFYRLELEGSP